MTKKLNMNNPAAFAAFAAGDVENFLAAATPGGIERQEAEGQRSFVADETLPTEIRNVPRKRLTKAGFRFGEYADDLFVRCGLPKGWSKRPTDHSMWSDLLDDRGRVRARIFYKAAFYDRKAHMDFVHRFTIDAYHNETLDRTFEVAILDCDRPIEVLGKWSDRDYRACDQLVGAAKAALDKRYPEWNDPLAYWDEV